jgi:hypothetical protein
VTAYPRLAKAVRRYAPSKVRCLARISTSSVMSAAKKESALRPLLMDAHNMSSNEAEGLGCDLLPTCMCVTWTK